ncbi:hypothetical protein Cgig2_014911 [Carnegiea gigantea]|uniref:Uncharacterized protein n=1 Tax=Carnegiea gigantea TaxID=171969 RepID=A0A9Q1JNY0_9CARY|nr:hypothetical protein Cgig2_014911 [Carnegiea gigantea]
MDLITLALNCVDEDYHILAATLSYGTNLLIFDDLLAKLIHFQQRVRFLKFKGTPIVRHQALNVSQASAGCSASPVPKILQRLWVLPVGPRLATTLPLVGPSVLSPAPIRYLTPTLVAPSSASSLPLLAPTVGEEGHGVAWLISWDAGVVLVDRPEGVEGRDIKAFELKVSKTKY